MKTLTKIAFLNAVFSSLVSGMVLAGPPLPAELLAAPEGVACKVTNDGEQIFNIAWSEIEGAKKYSVELSCDSSIGDLNIEAEVSKSSMLCDSGTCSGAISEAEVANAIQQAIDAGKIELPELAEGETLGWLCQAEVKGLNPPKKRQNHPKGKAACVEETASVCPVWSPSELATIGTQSQQASMFKRVADLENRTYDSKSEVYMDQELTVDAAGYLLNFASVFLNGEGYVGQYYLESVLGEKIDRKVFITQAEYEACKLDLISHEASSCDVNLFLDQNGNCVAM